MSSLFTEFLALMDRGGPVMWVIFVTAWLAIILLIERAISLQWLLKQAQRDHLGFKRDEGYFPSGLRGGSPVARVLRHLNWDEIDGREELIKQLNSRLGEMVPKLEGTLPTVAVIGTLLPMLGLLGTVVGMIEVFDVIALHGTGNPQEMAHGISQALLTTASGLIIAIPVIFFHHLLVQRLNLLLGVTERCIHLVIDRDMALNRPAAEAKDERA